MTVEVVLFDMGGVLVDVTAPTALVGLAPEDEREAWRRWIDSPAVRAFERGGLSIDEAADAVIEEFELTSTRAEVVDRIVAIPDGLLPGAAELVVEVRARVPVGILSNTNELHWTAQRDAEVLRALFDHEFLSYVVGQVKPDAELFEHVLAELDRPGEAVLFLDDNQVNVDGAVAAGLTAHVARGPIEARDVLVAVGVLEASAPTD